MNSPEERNSITPLLPVFCLLALLIVGTQPTTASQSSDSRIFSGSAKQARENEAPKERLPESWSDSDVFALRTFSEPLVGGSKVASDREREAFFKAVNAYLAGREPESLEGFLRDWPESRWAPALEHNLGLLKYREGFFTAAMGYWKRAWERAKDSKEPRLRALANQALAELAHMQARLGRIEVLRPLVDILKEREAGGSAGQILGSSADALHEMEKRPDQSFKCGPFALAQIRKALGIPNALAPEILEAKSPYRGFSLTEVSELATQLGMPNTMAKWSDATAEIPVPAVVNWKLGHYAAIIGKEAGKYRLRDLTFGFENFVSAEAIRTEASGYFLLPVANLPEGFEMVSASEGWKVFGRGNPNLDMPNQTSDDDHQLPKRCRQSGMADYTVHTMMVSLHVEDTPLAYDSPFGPQVRLTVSHNERETLQPANLNSTNLGRQWTHNWNGSIRINMSTAATVVLRGGGSEDHRVNPADPNFSYIHPKSRSRLLKISPARWDRLLPDGSREVYEALVSPDPQGLETFWLRQIVDPAGNALTLQYDSNYRLSTITDALGQKTTFSYSVPDDIYKVSRVTDPFGRQATFSYNENGQLVAITDVIGIQSQFGYQDGDIVASMTTPYGTTTFTRAQSSGTERWLEVTDPLGGKERFDSRVSAPGIIDDPPAAVPASTVTVGSDQAPFYTYNQFLNARNTYYWDKKRMLEAPGDYTKAKIFHFLHARDYTLKSPILECVKEPLENRVWFNYPGQTDSSSNIEGTLDAPIKVARVIEDGTTQLWQYDRNALGNVTRSVDPLGRETRYDFAPNGIDLLAVHHLELAASSTLLDRCRRQVDHLQLEFAGPDPLDNQRS